MTDNRRLIIRISSDSLSFSTMTADGVSYEPYSLNCSISMAANLREALRTQPALRKPAERTLVMIDSPVLLVPTQEFPENTEEQAQYYHHAFSQQEQVVVKHIVLPDLNCVAIFSIQKDLNTVVNDTYSNASFMPAVAPVWRHLHQRSYTGPRQKLYAYFHEHHMEVFSFSQNRFKFCNSYAVQSPNNALYFMLSAWKQLAMVAEHDELHLAGDLPEREALIEEAQKFIKRVFYINPSGEFNRAAVTQIEHMPYDLMVLFVKGR